MALSRSQRVGCLHRDRKREIERRSVRAPCDFYHHRLQSRNGRVLSMSNAWKRHEKAGANSRATETLRVHHYI